VRRFISKTLRSAVQLILIFLEKSYLRLIPGERVIADNRIFILLQCGEEGIYEAASRLVASKTGC